MVKKFLSIITVIGLLMACNNEKETIKTSVEEEQLPLIEFDYSKIDTSVTKVLNEMENFSIEVNLDGKEVNKIALTEFFDVEKTKFRMRIENEIGSSNMYKDVEIDAESYVNNYLKALTKADEKYGVTVTQEEVTKFIDENIALVSLEERSKYAQALGITRYELDYVFDRDIYIMDTLWEKLIPVLMGKYPELTLDEIKEIFYNET